jgi:hypothetical protein
MSKVIATKNHVIIKEGLPITHAILVKQGSLKLEKQITVENTTFWPSGKEEWEQNTNRQLKRRKICEIHATEYFGVIDEDSRLQQNLFYPGNLLSNEDNTTILMVPNTVIKELLTTFELDTLIATQVHLP